MKPSGKIAAADSGRPKRKKKKRSPGKTFFYLIATGILAWAAYYFFYEDHSFSDIWFDIADWFEDLY